MKNNESPISTIAQFLNRWVVLIWGLSFVLAFGGDEINSNINILTCCKDVVNFVSPLADGFHKKSEFPLTSYLYFSVMQPASFVLFLIALKKPIFDLEMKSVENLYRNRKVIGRVGSWIFLVCIIVLLILCYFFVGGQNLPATRLNSSRLSLAVFGPIAASGLVVFLALCSIRIAVVYTTVQKEK